MALHDGSSPGEDDALKGASEPRGHFSAREKRKSTMKRGVAVLAQDSPLDDGAPSRPARREQPTPSGREHRGAATKESLDGTATDGDDCCHLASEEEEEEEGEREEQRERDALLSAKERNGTVKQLAHLRSSGKVWSPPPPSSAAEGHRKRDMMVSKESAVESETRTRAYVRHASDMSSGCYPNEAEPEAERSGANRSDRCRQCLELCQSFFRPCSPCCKRPESTSSPGYTPTRQRGIFKYEESIIIPEDPFRKRCIHACMTFVYVLLVGVGVVVTYSMLADLVESMNNPVRSIHYHKVGNYDAPGIAVYPGGAEFLACGHYYNNVVTSKVRLTQLDLVNRNCSFTRMHYRDPHYPDIERDAIVIRGPTSFTNREAIFLHFALEDETRDFFTVSYFVFPDFDQFNTSGDRVGQMLEFHKYMPTFALSAGLRMWIKLIMSETYLMDDSKHTDFNVEYSVVRFVDRRPENEKHRHLFFIFFEWKNDIIEQSRLLYSTTPWSIGAGLCGVFLTLHRVYQLAQVSYKRMRKDQQRRSIRKRTLRELRQRSMESGSRN